MTTVWWSPHPQTSTSPHPKHHFQPQCLLIAVSPHPQRLLILIYTLCILSVSASSASLHPQQLLILSIVSSAASHHTEQLLILSISLSDTDISFIKSSLSGPNQDLVWHMPWSNGWDGMYGSNQLKQPSQVLSWPGFNKLINPNSLNLT